MNTKTVRLTIIVTLVSLSVPAAARSPQATEPFKGRAEGFRAAAASGKLGAVLERLGTTTFPAAEGESDELSATTPVGLTAAIHEVLPAATAAPVVALLDAVLAGDAMVRDVVGDRSTADELTELPPESVARMVAATRDLGSAVDALLASEAPAGIGTAGAGCDVLDARPLLCLSGDGVNTHEAWPYWLSIDLGGSDVYENHVGVGACLDAADEEPESCVSVSVDLGGDDEYAPPGLLDGCVGYIDEQSYTGRAHGGCAQGAGVFGIGMLVDAAGEDSYAATALTRPDPGCLDENPGICGTLVAQGTGTSGVGVLADLAGDDTYLASAPDTPPDGDRNVTLHAQGAGIFGGGLLWDAGGDDHFLIRGPATGYLHPSGYVQGWGIYSGQGLGIGGEGVLLEAGGNDRFEILTRPDPDAASRTERHPFGEGAGTGAQGLFGGQGAGSILPPGLGALIEGPGDTSYVIDHRGRFNVHAAGQGLDSGLLDDLGGADTYVLSASMDADFTSTCSGCSHHEVRHEMSAFPGSIRGQGAGEGGTLSDHGGSDTYVASLVQRTSLTARNTASLGSASATLRNGSLELFAQGSLGGQLVDLEGDDRYRADADVELDVHAIAERIREAAVEATWGYLDVLVQGGGGELTDLGGGDIYEVSALQTAETDPERPGGSNEGALYVAGQGIAGSGTLTDIDDGDDDAFRIDSPMLFSMCGGARGTHGSSPGWEQGFRFMARDPNSEERCVGSGGGQALVSSASAPAGRASLTVLDIHRLDTADDPLYSVTVRLEESGSSEPIAGARIRLAPQQLLSIRPDGPVFAWDFPVWYLADEVETDETGVATGIIGGVSTCLTCSGRARALAMFFGSETHRPVAAAGSLNVG